MEKHPLGMLAISLQSGAKRRNCRSAPPKKRPRSGSQQTEGKVEFFKKDTSKGERFFDESRQPNPTPMSTTHLSLHYHIVFSTKNRTRSIASEWKDRLHDYIGGTIRSLGGFPEEVGGITDHVHVLAGLKATHTLSSFVRDFKRASSLWIREEMGVKGFAWQEGYAAFTVSASTRSRVRHYILHQEEHHRVKSFEEEWQEMMARAEILERHP